MPSSAVVVGYVFCSIFMIYTSKGDELCLKLFTHIISNDIHWFRNLDSALPVATQSAVGVTCML